MGDFYQGDFYQGDPGIGSFFRRIGGIAASFIPGIGGAASTALAKVGSRGGVLGTIATRGTAIVKAGARTVAGHPVLTAAGAAGVVGAMAGGGAVRMMGPPAMAGGMKGFHLSRPRKGVPSHLVRNRHMRVTNPKALRRAIRRTGGFAKLAMRTIHLVHPKKRARFGGFRRRRARTRS
jgi:hypothetical protein